jgi:hypothetical protein
MKKAIHHVMLNEKLEDCFGILDAIQRTYRDYNSEYCKIVQGHPKVMNDFFVSFEQAICKQFKMWPAEQREQVEEMLRKETEEKQAKLEEEALKEFEAKKADEERVREEQAKVSGAKPGK